MGFEPSTPYRIFIHLACLVLFAETVPLSKTGNEYLIFPNTYWYYFKIECDIIMIIKTVQWQQC